ncbi:PRC-barrel domain-containing protein [Aquicoccus sp. G2-2]|uniref:PRC-barrel domain-containing protein n=1 Tax=Aquicoccus sp. G2-2 TaxID=3092120 RepID=UPI002AE060FE|nr:PRC-barrel domain-containing protein [Aquicoccus sp. G2-2]MEA1114862.1 PRC-barrel domain-containing protein [Aquicoccus sp. G2-2]
MTHAFKTPLVLAVLCLPLSALAATIDKGFDYSAIQPAASSLFFPPTQRASGMVGAKVLSSDNKILGTVKDLIFDAKSTLTGYVVVTSGFLGYGAASVFVPVAKAHMQVDDHTLKLVVARTAKQYQSDAQLAD